MGCKICGRNSCTSSFHSIEEQTEFEEKTEHYKQDIKNQLLRQLAKLDWSDNEDEYYVKREDVENMIDDILW